MEQLTLDFDELCEYLFDGLLDFGYAPTEEEVEVIASIVIDFFLFEVLGLDMGEIEDADS